MEREYCREAMADIAGFSVPKFHPYVKQKYQFTFSERKNMSARDLCRAKKALPNFEVVATEKEDGVATLLVVTWQKIDITGDLSITTANGVEIHQNNEEFLNQEFTLSMRDTLTKMCRVWSDPLNYFTIRKWNAELYRISVRLYRPKHDKKPLSLPHLFRLEIEELIVEKLVLNDPSAWDAKKSYYLAFRCEFLVGNDGPNAALQQIRKWGNPKELGEIDKSTQPATRYKIPQKMYEFSLNLIDRQWNVTDIQEKNVRLCILDTMQSEAFDQAEIDFGFPDQDKNNVKMCDIFQTSDKYSERLDKIEEKLFAGDPDTGLVTLVKRDKEIENFIVNDQNIEIETKLKKLERLKDLEGYIICLQKEDQVMFFKLKNFRVLTLSISECKNNYKWFGGKLTGTHRDDLKNHNLIYFFNGNHFLQTNNFKQVKTDKKGEFRIVPNCFKLTRWGTFKDINSAHNSVDSGTKYLCQDFELWQNTRYACVWTHYVKEARIRLNFPAFLPNRFDHSNGRISQYINNTVHPELVALKGVFSTPESDDRAEQERKYDEGVFRDIMWCMFLYAVIRCEFDLLMLSVEVDFTETDDGQPVIQEGKLNIWRHLGQIGRQICKNMFKFDFGENLSKGVQIKSLLKSFDETYEDQYDEDNQQLYSNVTVNSSSYDDFCTRIESFDAMFKTIDITNFEYDYWKVPGMLVESKLFDKKFDNDNTSNEMQLNGGHESLYNFFKDRERQMAQVRRILEQTNDETQPIDCQKFLGFIMKTFFKKWVDSYSRLRWKKYANSRNVFDFKREKVDFANEGSFNPHMIPICQFFYNMINKQGEYLLHVNDFATEKDFVALELLQELENCMHVCDLSPEQQHLISNIFEEILTYYMEFMEEQHESGSGVPNIGELRTKMETRLSHECFECIFGTVEIPLEEDREYMSVFLKGRKTSGPADTSILQSKMEACNAIFDDLRKRDMFYMWAVNYNEALHVLFDKHKPTFYGVLRDLVLWEHFCKMMKNDVTTERQLQSRHDSFVSIFTQIRDKLLQPQDEDTKKELIALRRHFWILDLWHKIHWPSIDIDTKTYVSCQVRQLKRKNHKSPTHSAASTHTQLTFEAFMSHNHLRLNFGMTADSSVASDTVGEMIGNSNSGVFFYEMMFHLLQKNGRGDPAFDKTFSNLTTGESQKEFWKDFLETLAKERNKFNQFDKKVKKTVAENLTFFDKMKLDLESIDSNTNVARFLEGEFQKNEPTSRKTHKKWQNEYLLTWRECWEAYLKCASGILSHKPTRARFPTIDPTDLHMSTEPDEDFLCVAMNTELLFQNCLIDWGSFWTAEWDAVGDTSGVRFFYKLTPQHKFEIDEKKPEETQQQTDPSSFYTYNEFDNDVYDMGDDENLDELFESREDEFYDEYNRQQVYEDLETLEEYYSKQAQIAEQYSGVGESIDLENSIPSVEVGDSVDDAIRESEYFDLSKKYSLSQKTSLNQKIKTLILFLKKNPEKRGLVKANIKSIAQMMQM